MNNYRRHLEIELRSKLAEAETSKAIVDQCEQAWRRIAKIRETCEGLLDTCIAIEKRAKETFRNTHSRFAGYRQELGEIQEELFRTGEEQEDWH